MPFCGSCGTEVKGSFCSQCGAASSAATARPAAVPPPGVSPMPSPMPPPQVGARRKTSPWVWILVAIGGVILLCILGAVAVVGYLVSKPEVVLAKMVTATNPNVEMVNVDKPGRQITFRDKRNGQEVTLSFDDIQQGRFSLTATDENGKVGHVELGAGAGRVPAWVPAYPGAKMEAHASGSGDDGKEFAEGGMFSFSSPDAPSKVMSYYQDKCRDLGMKVELSTATTDGGHIVAEDEDGRRSLLVIIGSGAGDGTSGSVTFKRKR
jgi:hypothetical protein